MRRGWWGQKGPIVASEVLPWAAGSGGGNPPSLGMRVTLSACGRKKQPLASVGQAWRVQGVHFTGEVLTPPPPI